MYDCLIVGAGFAGSVLAERLAASGEKVLLIDKRTHYGGNAYDGLNEDGVMVHKYGPHIFHTNSELVFNYLSQFTTWRKYEHHVLAKVGAAMVPVPINQNTINSLYGLSLDEAGIIKFLHDKGEPIEFIKNSRDKVISQVGIDLYQKLFEGYTRKQWGVDASELNASVTGRIPVRTNTDNRYFTDTYQFMPAEGYLRMFDRMLDSDRIEILLGVDFEEVRETVQYKKLVYTGPVDAYFKYCYGKLPYRSLNFVYETYDCKDYVQPVAVLNYPNDYDFTRSVEYKHITGQHHNKTTICFEYPTADGDPYYPVPAPANDELYKKYELLAMQERNTYFVGRLASYKYYNMDQVVAQALSTFKRIKFPLK